MSFCCYCWGTIGFSWYVKSWFFIRENVNSTKNKRENVIWNLSWQWNLLFSCVNVWNLPFPVAKSWQPCIFRNPGLKIYIWNPLKTIAINHVFCLHFHFMVRVCADVKSALSMRHNMKHTKYFPWKRELGNPSYFPPRSRISWWRHDIVALTCVCMHTANGA